MEPVYKAANRLAAQLNHHPWYHRTSVRETFGNLGRRIRVVHRELRVYVEKPPHHEVPGEFEGYPVVQIEVSRRNPCLFGSVKAEYAD